VTDANMPIKGFELTVSPLTSPHVFM